VDESLSCQVSLRSNRKAGDSTASSRRRRRGAGGGGGEVAAAAAGLEDAVLPSDTLYPPIDLEDSSRIADNLSCSLSGLLARRYVAAVDSDRYDRDREGRTVRQDGGLDERQDAVHQKPTGLPWDQERSLRGLHGAVLFCTYFVRLSLFIRI